MHIQDSFSIINIIITPQDLHPLRNALISLLLNYTIPHVPPAVPKFSHLPLPFVAGSVQSPGLKILMQTSKLK